MIGEILYLYSKNQHKVIKKRIKMSILKVIISINNEDNTLNFYLFIIFFNIFT